jgi:hypothetical protein
MNAAATHIAIWLVLWIALSLACSLLWRFARQPLHTAQQALHPVARANTLRLIALAPLLISTALVAGLFQFPGLLIEPHCHPQHCSVHSPAIALSGWALAALLSVALPALLPLLAGLQRTRRIAQQWHALSEDGGAFRILPSSAPVACAIGFFRPTIYLSSGMLEQLPAAAIATITAHERAHVQRRDNLWLTVIRIACPFWMQRNTLIDAIELAHDQACDRAAAEQVGDPLVVADTLVRCGRLAQSPTLAASFLRGHLAARVEAILHDDVRAIAPLHKLFLGGLLILAIAATVPLLHSALERLLAI